MAFRNYPLPHHALGRRFQSLSRGGWLWTEIESVEAWLRQVEVGLECRLGIYFTLIDLPVLDLTGSRFSASLLFYHCRSLSSLSYSPCPSCFRRWAVSLNSANNYICMPCERFYLYGVCKGRSLTNMHALQSKEGLNHLLRHCTSSVCTGI